MAENIETRSQKEFNHTRETAGVGWDTGCSFSFLSLWLVKMCFYKPLTALGWIRNPTEQVKIFISPLRELMFLSLSPQMKAVAGLKMSYQVQQAIHGPKVSVIRGFRHEDSDTALCSHLYSMVRGNRQHRRAFLISLLNLFDDSTVSSSPPENTFSSCVSLCLLFNTFFPCYRKQRWTCCSS